MTTELDQHILVDENTLNEVVNLAELNENDIVLEVGAGPGNLTHKLSQKAGKVIALEIDRKFEPDLKTLSDNVEIIWGNAVDYFQMNGKFHHTKNYNKIVANPPYSLCEPLLHNLTFVQYDKVILLVPMGFAEKAKANPVFNSFFAVEEKLQVPKANFNPPPRTESVVINLIRLPDPVVTKNRELFLRQYLYKHEGQKAYNALTEGLILFARLAENKTLTKNEAREIIDNINIPVDLLESTPNSPEIYDMVKNSF